MPFARYLLFALLGLSAAAETLDDAWNSAAANNAGLSAAMRLQDAAVARQAASRALSWPSLALSASSVHVDSPPDATLDTNALAARLAGTPLAGALPASISTPLTERNVTMADLALTWPVFTSGKITATQRAAEAGVAVADANRARAGQSLKLDVAQAYVNVLRANAAHDVAVQYRDSIQAHRADVQAMEKRGMAAPYERMTADVALADAERKLIDANQAVELSRAAYNRLLGREMDRPVKLDPIAVQPLEDAPDTLWETALQHRPELAALQAGQQALNEQARAVRSEDGPQLALQAMELQWHGLPLNESHAATVGVVMRWSLFDAGLHRHQAGALKAEASAIADQRRDAETAIRLELRHAELEQTASRERERVTRSAGELAAEALRLTQSRYRNGLATQTEVLAAETRQADAERAYDDARFDFQLACLQLRRAIGEL